MTDVASELPGPVARKARIMLGPFRGERFRAPLFMRPEGEMLMGYGILLEAPPSEMEEVLPILARESRRIIDAGGKRYLSGWLDFDRQEWQEHYGDLWAQMLGVEAGVRPSAHPEPRRDSSVVVAALPTLRGCRDWRQQGELCRNLPMVIKGYL